MVRRRRLRRRGRGLTPRRLPGRRLPRSAYRGLALDVARSLLGAHLVSELDPGRVVLRITEVEAYAGSDDAASHGYRGRTARNATMFGPPGHAYVYFTYGMHWCLNVVTGAAGEASAVLIRAGEVVDGIDAARNRRGCRSDRDLARGPARLAQALGVTGALDGVDLTSAGSPLRLHSGSELADGDVAAGPRVGIRVGTELPWRLWIAADPSVSTFRAGQARRRRTG